MFGSGFSACNRSLIPGIRTLRPREFTRDKLGLLLALSFSAFYVNSPGGLCAAGTWQGPQEVKIGEGIHLFNSPDVGADVDGNSLVVINDRDVFVVDSNVLPSTAQNVLTEIRKLTPKPVRNVMKSHWHPDHGGGNQMYAQGVSRSGDYCQSGVTA